MLSVPLLRLSLLRVGSRLFFFALHFLNKSYRFFNALGFLSVSLDCFEYRLKFSVRHSLVNLFIQVLHLLPVNVFPSNTPLIASFRIIVRHFSKNSGLSPPSLPPQSAKARISCSRGRFFSISPAFKNELSPPSLPPQSAKTRISCSRGRFSSLSPAFKVRLFHLPR